MSGKRSKQSPKVRGKRDVLDEWEVADIDRDEQKAGLKRRERRWKEIELMQRKQRELEKEAIEKADKMKNPKTRPPTPLEEAWLRCDYVLWNIMDQNAYNIMEWCRHYDVDAYKYLYKIFMSKYMMTNIQYFVDYFAAGFKMEKRINVIDVRKKYLKYKGYKPSVVVKRKGEKDRSLSEIIEEE